MADAEEKARQEKLAAARKRVEQMKKKKNKKAADSKKDDSGATETPPPEAAEAAPDAPTEPSDSKPADAPADDAAVADDKAVVEENTDNSSPSATPSLAQQSKMRSTSFRAGSGSGSGTGTVSPAPFSPDGDTAPDIYRKHVAKIEELEKENKRLSKEATEAEKRWKKAEEELSDLREADGEAPAKASSNTELEKLKSEVASLQRQNAQLQQQVSRGSSHGHRPSMSMASPPSELQADLASKIATIESMEIEISKLKARVERQETGASSEREQVTALEEKLARAEAAAGKAQRELQDVKRNLERATEKAVREGSERSSAETKVKTLEHEAEQLRAAKDELEKKADGLDKKVATLTTLHKEQDARSQTLRKDKERADKEAEELRSKVEKLESENIKLRSRKSAEGGGGLDDEGVDELENEERLRLERKIRTLEKEVHNLRSGAWIEKRREMEATSPGFHDVDLTGGSMGASPHKKHSGGGGFGDFLTSGLNALAGGGDDEGFMEDEDADFDEDAFRKAQEEEAQKRIERIKEIKRSLKHWEGWRLDIVDMRRGGGEGVGDIFDV
ncbi:hypothetical protein JDV02_007207 [Purpureocillium takamizusanense]|uniref:M protein repeat protein n=1 Tax=Purpureocillium takamizusanense TaxID=2060973 RepID=A0A9Q8QLZ0_9HYPO|nr:uncharacterized protein JDV02_007207 [Purpureocillium takamizusanense]UNI21196.1 hypothetical protein JDV02_007207 [Purpureocillium takamizusanense]